MNSVENCPGFIPNPWRKKKCRHCGHSQHSHPLPAIQPEHLPTSPEIERKLAESSSSSLFKEESSSEMIKAEIPLTQSRDRIPSILSSHRRTPSQDSPRKNTTKDSAIEPSIVPRKISLPEPALRTQSNESNQQNGGSLEDKKKEKKLKKEKKHKKEKKSDASLSKARSGSLSRKDKIKEHDDDAFGSKGRSESLMMGNKETLNQYILVDKIGKGAFGVVFKAINIEDGSTVAVKKLYLKNCSKEVVESLNSEIQLLKSLDHDNITRYIDNISNGKELNIVMEFVENGSLASMVKKYGRFPEPLAKVYIKKTLVGLEYLHDQGVIHRDIKPDNILITKSGGVKLADFGVSTKLKSAKGGDEDGQPAGTPYYMAPEVIEFYGARPQSDIWSLGCTVIELLKGTPPYFDHDQFAAMYKMVEDEHPPLPSGISQSLYHFLMECFKKDVNYRVGATELLKHPWLADTAKKQPGPIIETGKEPGKGYNQVTDELEKYNEKLKKEIGERDDDDEEEEKKDIVEKNQTLNSELSKLMLVNRKTNRPEQPKVEPVKPKKPIEITPEIEDDDWSKDFAENKKPNDALKDLQNSLANAAAFDDFEFDDFGTIPTLNLNQFKDDLAELDFDSNLGEPDDQKLKLPSEKHFPMKLQSNSAPAQDSGKLKLKAIELNIDDIEWPDEDEPSPVIEKPKISPKTPKKNASPSTKNSPKQKLDLSKWVDEPDGMSGLAFLESPAPKILNAFKEDDSDFNDLELKGSVREKGPAGTMTGKSGFLARLETKKGQQWSDEWETELILDDDIKDENFLMKEKAQEALLFDLKSQLKALKPNCPEEEIKKSCHKLLDIFDKNPELKSQLITNHGLLPLIDLLNLDNVVIMNAILRLITQIIENNVILVNLCIMGIIPVIMNCGNSDHPSITRLYAAYFVQRVIMTGETLQMFVACRGLSVLVGFLEPNYKNNKEIVHIAIDCISSIFRIRSQTAAPKNEYFHLFLNAGILERLSVTLVNLLSDTEKTGTIKTLDPEEQIELNYIEKVCKIFKVFSLGDSEVRARMCTTSILDNLKSAFKKMAFGSTEMLMMLQMVRNVSFDRVILQNLSILLLPLLEIGMHFVKRSKFRPEIFNQITHCLFHLCRISRSRQEIAVKGGLIPFLTFVIQNNKPLKEFAVPLMCELAGSSQVSRSILLENNGVHFYLDLLKDGKGMFLTDAMEAIAVCLEHERERVEEVILSLNNINSLKMAFVHVQDHELVKLLESMQRICFSVRISREILSDSSEDNLVSTLQSKLHHPASHTRVNLLKTLSILCAKCAEPSTFLKTHNLLKTVKHVAAKDSSALVRKMALTLLEEGSPKR